MARAAGAATYYGNPSKSLSVIGVTGTDGKTTTTYLVYHILKSAGKRTSMLSSVYAKIGEKEYDTGLHMTTPDATLVQKLLRNAVMHGDEYFVLETTSHAFDQNRNWGIHYKVGVITNITPEHLDYHKTYENYLKTKAKLLLRSDVSLVNHDDGSYEPLSQFAKEHDVSIKTYGIDTPSDYQRDFKREFGMDITDFNNYNYLAAYAVCRSLGLTDEVIIAALKTFTLPKGRMDVIYDKSFTVIIDFAHTANSFEQLLSHLKKKTDGRIIHVFGAAGLRDAEKRPHMGSVSAKYADVMIVTEEDYRIEDPQSIADSVISTIPDREKRIKNGTLIIDLHRNSAIKRAIGMAKKDDVVVLTGKSHEKSLCRGTIEEPWDEYKSAWQAIESRKNKKS